MEYMFVFIFESLLNRNAHIIRYDIEQLYLSF